VRVTFLPETEVESTEYVSPPTKTVKALAGAVELDKFSLKTIGTVVPFEGVDAETTVGGDVSRERVDEFVTGRFVNERASIPDWL
jgi:hypothetical protein